MNTDLTSAAQLVADLWHELPDPLVSGRFESALESLAAASDHVDAAPRIGDAR
jgi:hypothetical protein